MTDPTGDDVDFDEWDMVPKESANQLFIHKPTRRFVKIITQHGSQHAEVATRRLFHALALPHLDAQPLNFPSGAVGVHYKYDPKIRDTLDRVGTHPLVNPFRHVPGPDVLRVAAGDWLGAVEDRHGGQFAVGSDGLPYSIDHGVAAHPATLHKSYGPVNGWHGYSHQARYTPLIGGVLRKDDHELPLPKMPSNLESLLVAHADEATHDKGEAIRHQAKEAAKRRAGGYQAAKTWADLPR